MYLLKQAFFYKVCYTLFMKYKTIEEKWARRREKSREYSRRRREKVNNDPVLKSKSLEWQKEYRSKHPEKFNKNFSLKSKLKSQYNLSLDEYNAIIREQNGVCAICFKSPMLTKRLAVDHCHTTKKVRGLLCTACNVAIGLMKNNPILFENAKNYLIHSPKQVETIIEHYKTKSPIYREIMNAPRVYQSKKPIL